MKNIARIIRISKPLHGIFYGILGLALLGGLLQQVAPIISKNVVDEIQVQIETGDGDIDRLYMLIAAGFVASLFAILIDSLNQRLGDHFGGEIRRFLTERFYDHIFRLPQSYFDTEISGKIVNQLNRGIISVEQFMKTASNFIFPTFLQAILTLGLMYYYSWQVGLFTTILFPVYIGISYVSAKRWGKREIEKNKHEDVTRGRIQEVISNMGLVKGFSNQMNEYKFISKELITINNIYAKQSTEFHILDFIRNLSLNIVLLGINIVIFYNTFQGNYSLGELVLLISLVFQIRRPLFVMSFILTQIQQTESGTKEFFEIMDLEKEEAYEKGVEEMIKNPSITFEDVEFHYDDSKEVLRNVSFTIDSNQKVALVGHSGAGKTTVINLITKFYNPSAGTIKLGDKSYKELSHNEVRRNISLVFQENELFSTTIRENVAYGMKSSEEDIEKALRAANAWDFVNKLVQGIDTEIGERGIKLSGGQKQRIQIARAILHDTPVVILDEATSNLDSKSEKEVQEALETLMKDRIVIIIAHRFSTIQNVDKILVLDEGKIADAGSPKDLANREGIYRDLLHYQIDGDKKLLQNFDLY